MPHIQAVRGMNDLLPDTTACWQIVESRWRQLMVAYGYQEIRLPLLEKTTLFRRSIGEVTDIVEKEMYTFTDRNDEQLTLRPEGTAGCVRAAIEHGLLYHQQQKLWYHGAMFRYERPQKGRYRQFHQLGVETFGYDNALIEAELILILARFWRHLGIDSQVILQINSLGDATTRAAYREALVTFCQAHYNQLDEDCQRRLLTNPLRILDSKNPDMQLLLQRAPKITDYLSDSLADHFEQLKILLTENAITYVVNPHLVRGLDYYTGTVFEWVTTALGTQGAVAAGGRYDKLVEQLGGVATPAVGFAIGMERIIDLYQQTTPAGISIAEVYIIAMTKNYGMRLAEKLHNHLPNIKILCDIATGSIKSQFKRADKNQARYALIVTEDQTIVTVKNLRQNVPQQLLNFDQLVDYLRRAFCD